MDHPNSVRAKPQSASNKWRTIAPLATLIFLSPVLVELLPGIIRVSFLWLLVPEMAVYGVAAVLIREAARRLHRGWATILLLGIAYAVAEECLILQTSLTPQFFPASTSSFGWAVGVQWIYLVAMLGYESVYAIVLPIALTELLFPDRRDDPWLSQRGIVIALVVFLLGCASVWWFWTHVGLYETMRAYGYGDLVQRPYQIPLLNIGLALVAIVVFIALGLGLPRPAEKPATKHAWSPWILGLIAFIFGLFWWVMVGLPYIPASVFRGASPLIPIVIGLIWAMLAMVVISSLSSNRKGWQDRHRLALIFGAELASMIGGTLVILAAPRVDKIGKLVLDLIALILFVALAWLLRKRRPRSLVL
jgi:MFS family permease